jgi:HPr kinase/phosphorylase
MGTRRSLHGTLVEVLGVGVLLLGSSGVGKSETALELIQRGHRLVADDVVELSVERDRLMGESPELIRHHLEIRGIGILYVPDLYGRHAVRDRWRVELECRLEPWQAGREYERVGLVRPTRELLSVEVPSLLLPVRPAGNMATLVEVAVRDHLQRAAGVVAASRLDERVRSRAMKDRPE